MQLLALLLQLRHGLKNGTRLHYVDLGIEQAQAASAQSQHRVCLAHRTDSFEQLALLLQFLFVSALYLQRCHLDQQVLIVGEELVQRRIDQTDDDGIALARLGIDHRFEDSLEVAALEGQQLIERGLTNILIGCQNHLLYDRQALLLHKHMLGAAESDTFGTIGNRALGIAWIVRVGPHAERAELIGPIQQCAQIDLFTEIGVDRLDDACEYLARRAVDGDIIAFFQHETGIDNAEKLLVLAHTNAFGTGNAGQTQAARDHRRMAGSATSRRQNAPGNQHPVHIVRAGLRAYQDDRYS